MTDQSVHALAKRVADAYAELVECREAEDEKREALSAAAAERQAAETHLLNAREALDKATGVQSGMMGETFVVGA